MFAFTLLVSVGLKANPPTPLLTDQVDVVVKQNSGSEIQSLCPVVLELSIFTLNSLERVQYLFTSRDEVISLQRMPFNYRFKKVYTNLISYKKLTAHFIFKNSKVNYCSYRC